MIIRKFFRYVAVLSAFLLLPLPAFSAPIAPGFDLFTTPDGTAFIDLTGIGLGLGVVDLLGNPIPGEPGDADTIVERITSLGAGETGTIDIELVALSLQSVAPVALNIGTGDAFFDIFVTLDPLLPSLGQMTILTHDDSLGDNGGGTFVSFFDVFVQLDFIGTSTGFILTLFGSDFIGEPPIPNEWLHLPEDNFRPIGVTSHTGPHPETISVPEPTTLVLLVLGLAGLGFRRRQKT